MSDGSIAAFPIVGIGASAGGLAAVTVLVSALPVDGGMAYIIVQHLDPGHKSMMAELLSGHTSMPVAEAIDGTVLQRDHVYVIPAGQYLSVAHAALHISRPTDPHGARLPIDFLFESMAHDIGARAVAIILSGTGADGSLGIAAIRDAGGLVIAQDITEAQFDGMPESAIATGLVDMVLGVAAMPTALLEHARLTRTTEPVATKSNTAATVVAQIIDLLRDKTTHDFTLYKTGTLQRRIERRMAMASMPGDAFEAYLEKLKTDPEELDLLASDLLINVTNFFRDTQVFDTLAKEIIPDIVKRHVDDRPIRIWVAGCSTGEEAYSLAMLFQEAIMAAKRSIKLCVFASDADADVVATAREGLYPETIAPQVGAERLARFFVREEHGYRVVADLRATVIFTVQDVLIDPPFSKLDFISCRNLMIYLGPEAQARVIALFHFALRRGGLLLLGSSETIGHAEDQFEPILKTQRLFRQIGKSRPGSVHFSMNTADGSRMFAGPAPNKSAAQQPALAELCRALIGQYFAPAVVLINRRRECLYSTGPIDRYLRVAPGYPTHDLLSQATPGLRTRLRHAIEATTKAKPHVVVVGGRAKRDGSSTAFFIDVRSVMHLGEELLLVSFIDSLDQQHRKEASTGSPTAPHMADLEHELEAVSADLRSALHELETSSEEHRAINEEALSVNEEYQSTNEELLTSKEELQSLNEELTALNGQLQETLERQRTTSNDLQNVLYSTNVATLFLDTDLKIRFFTPSIRALFNLIPGDIGRPLSDLNAIAHDPGLADDTRRVMVSHKPIQHEVKAAGDRWFQRRILPYRKHDESIGGVVITFIDITERKASRQALEAATREAEQANLAKSRFLAAASHDLRQPLQSLALIQGLLGRETLGEKAQQLLARLDQALVTMSSMLNTMLDINQIEAGIIQPRTTDIAVGPLFDELRDEFIDLARLQKLDLRFLPSSAVIHSDPDLLKQILRNLIVNALKYTKQGRILVGCRRSGNNLRIKVCDSGIGIAESELSAIFDEYHQVDNSARERMLGLGLGLSIVQRLGRLLGHRVMVRSQLGKGSVFTILVPVADASSSPPQPVTVAIDPPLVGNASPAAITGTILIVEDDRDVRVLLDDLLVGEGHRTMTADNAAAALLGVAQAKQRPDLILSDYNLPHGTDGLQLSIKLRKMLGPVPVIILTGDISTETMRKVALADCVQLNKPINRTALKEAIQGLLATARAPSTVVESTILQSTESEKAIDPPSSTATVYLVDDDDHVRAAIAELLIAEGFAVLDYPDGESFLAGYRRDGEACLLIDAYLPGMNGLALIARLKEAGDMLPAIMITGSSDVPMAVRAMKAGAIDFIEKPVGSRALLGAIRQALDLSRDTAKRVAWRNDAAELVGRLTKRQREIMDMVLAGHPSKNIAADLRISQRTVENHRAAIMERTGAKSLPALARLVLAALPDDMA
jgi:two-component system CheB/CheR fusion protein